MRALPVPKGRSRSPEGVCRAPVTSRSAPSQNATEPTLRIRSALSRRSSFRHAFFGMLSEVRYVAGVSGMRPIWALFAGVFLGSVVSCSSETSSGGRAPLDAGSGSDAGRVDEGGSPFGTSDAGGNADIDAMDAPVEGGNMGSMDGALSDGAGSTDGPALADSGLDGAARDSGAAGEGGSVDGAAATALEPNLPTPTHHC